MGILDGVKVLDISTLFAGPFIATLMGDHGADIIKVEHPKGDDARKWGAAKGDVSLFWKILSRNKKCISVDLNQAEGQEIIKKLVKNVDVIIENFRPGRMEKWGLSWDELRQINEGLILVRVTGFGQEGPYSNFAGFGTLAESMSGFAYITGKPDGPPTLPPFGLADGVAGIAGAFAVTSALLNRHRTGKGTVIDLALYEPLMWILGGQIIEYDQLGTIQERTGNQSTRTSPRNTYYTKDGKWIAMSASAQSIAERVFNAIGRPDIINDPKFKTNQDRLKHKNEVDEIIGNWVQEHTQEEALRIFRDAQAAVSPIYNSSQVISDEHFVQRGSIVTVDDPELGQLRMQGVFPKFSDDEGKIRWTGPHEIGAHTEEVLSTLGLNKEELDNLRSQNIIR